MGDQNRILVKNKKCFLKGGVIVIMLGEKGQKVKSFNYTELWDWRNLRTRVRNQAPSFDRRTARATTVVWSLFLLLTTRNYCNYCILPL